MQTNTRFFIARSRYGKHAIRLLTMRYIKGISWIHPLYRLLRIKRMWFGGHINWNALLHNKPLPARQSKSPRILIATSTGAHLAASRVEQTLGVALHLRDAKLSFLLCDGSLPACMMCESSLLSDTVSFVKSGPKELLCNTCFAPSASSIAPLGLPLHSYSDWLDATTKTAIESSVARIGKDELANFTQDGIRLGEHAMAASCRFFGTSDVFVMNNGETVLRRYLVAAWFTLCVCQKLFAQERPDIVVLHHGIYVPQGVIADYAKHNGIRVVTWHPAYRKGTFIFSHDDTYHRTMINEPTDYWKNMPWDAQKEEKIMRYLASRQTGSSDWIWFHESPLFDSSKIKKELALDENKPVIGLLTNVVWDAHLHYPNNAYSSMMEWLFDTIDHFKTRKDVQLVIRIHPAEIYGNVQSRQTVIDEIFRRYETLPPSIKIIPPLSDISTYSIMALCDSVLIYSTKTGIELATNGMQVIVAGEAWIRGKGFTVDANSPEEFRNILARLPLRTKLDSEKITLARRYAYHFFFRRMIDIELFIPTKSQPPFNLNIQSLDDLLTGECKGLDVVCNGIINGTPFIQ